LKFLSGHLAYALRDQDLHRNLRGLARYVAFLTAVITLYSVAFHYLMLHAEGREHSWITGVYWTLTVMSTLGFGDITFTSDVGRAFSVLVLVSGIILLLIVLPFAFIRYFYAPWLEARLRLRAPREAPSDVEGHVVFAGWDDVTKGLAPRLEDAGVPFFVVEEDGPTATALYGDDVPVVRGNVDDVATYEALRVERARMVVLNRNDLTNTNIALTVREISSSVRMAAIVEDHHSIDILELSGCDHVLPLKSRLGEQLANRVNAGHAEAHVVARYRELVIAEFSTHGTPLAGRTLGESRLREIAGVNVAGVWDRGRMVPPRPDTPLGDLSVPVVVGSSAAIDLLNEFLYIYDTNRNPVVVIGGGKVGRAAAQALAERSIPVHMVERDPEVARGLENRPEHLVIGDAADRRVMREVGIEEAPSIILTTNDDAANIYLATYCRRLNPDARILSRITHDRNLAAIQRAGADLTLSFTTLGVETLLALFHDRPPIVLGAGVAFHDLPCPPQLVGLTLRQSAIGERTGLTVIALEEDDRLVADTGPNTRLEPGSVLLALGTEEQVRRFRETYG
jgi:Trk K+ transport system NAD-binding subunit